LAKPRPSESESEFRRSRSSISTMHSRSSHETPAVAVVAVEAEVRDEVAAAAVKVVVITVLEETVETEALSEAAVVDLMPVVRLCLCLTTLLSLLWAGSKLFLHHSDGQSPEKPRQRTTKACKSLCST